MNNNNFPFNYDSRNRFVIPPYDNEATRPTIDPYSGGFIFPSSVQRSFFQSLTSAHHSAQPIPDPSFQAEQQQARYSSTAQQVRPQKTPARAPQQQQQRSPNWTDAETRYLVSVWKEYYPVSKRRNSSEWETIAKDLNALLKEQNINSIRTSVQCKARIKNLEDKRVKDHNSKSGNSHMTFPYYEDLDEVLGSRPKITPKSVAECGFASSSSSPSTSDHANSPKSPTEESDNNQNNETGGLKQKKSKVKQGTKRTKLDVDDADEDPLFRYLKESQERDQEFMQKLADKEAEREEKSQQMMFSTIKEIAKIFKEDN